MNENLTFRLEGVVKDKEEMQDFEGPLSLILMLLSKNKIEIRDIRISEILDQYLSWLDRMQKMDLEIASEFVQMASHLVYIKSRTLLAGTQEVSELEQLMTSLEQLQCRDSFAALKENLPALESALAQGLLLFSTPPEPMPRYGVYDYRHEPSELLGALTGMLLRGVAVPEEETGIPIPTRITYSVRDKGRQLLALLRQGPRPLYELFAVAGTRSELVATLLSVLELCSGGHILLETTDDICVVRAVDDTDAAESALETMDNEY